MDNKVHHLQGVGSSSKESSRRCHSRMCSIFSAGKRVQPVGTQFWFPSDLTGSTFVDKYGHWIHRENKLHLCCIIFRFMLSEMAALFRQASYFSSPSGTRIKCRPSKTKCVWTVDPAHDLQEFKSCHAEEPNGYPSPGLPLVFRAVAGLVSRYPNPAHPDFDSTELTSCYFLSSWIQCNQCVSILDS